MTRASLGLSTPFSRGGGAAPAHLHSGAVEVMHAIYWQREGGSALGILGCHLVLCTSTSQGSFANRWKQRDDYNVAWFMSEVSL